MSTLTTEECSPVKVAQVFADFRYGMPNSGTVYIGAQRHKVQVSRTAGGLIGKCACPNGCAAIPEAIGAVEITAEAWERAPCTREQATMDLDGRSDPAAEPEHREPRQYDGLARGTCEADLLPIDVPRWAYDERGIRRPLLEAEIAEDVWFELQRAFDRMLGEPEGVETAYRFPLFNYYRASWEPDRGMTHPFEADLQIGLDEENQPEGSTA